MRKEHWAFLQVIIGCILPAIADIGKTTEGSSVGVQRRILGVKDIPSFVGAVIPIRGLDSYVTNRLVIEDISKVESAEAFELSSLQSLDKHRLEE